MSVQAKLEVVGRKHIVHLTGFGAYSSTCYKGTDNCAGTMGVEFYDLSYPKKVFKVSFLAHTREGNIEEAINKFGVIFPTDKCPHIVVKYILGHIPCLNGHPGKISW